MCTTSVVVALYGTTGAAAAAGTVVGFILKGRLDAAGTPMLRETGSATGDGTENSDQAQTLPSLYACSPPLSSTCPPSFLLSASSQRREWGGRGEGRGSARASTFSSSPRSISSPLPCRHPPLLAREPPPRASVTALPTPLLSSLFSSSSPRFASSASPRLASSCRAA